MHGVDQLATFIVDGRKVLDGENLALHSLSRLTLHLAKEERERKEEPEKALVKAKLCHRSETKKGWASSAFERANPSPS